MAMRHMGTGKAPSTGTLSNGRMQLRFTILVLLTLLLPAALPGPAWAEKKEEGAFVAMDTLTATVIAGNGRHQIMTVQAGVDAPDKALRDYAVKVTPRLRGRLRPGACSSTPAAWFPARRRTRTTWRAGCRKPPTGCWAGPAASS